MAEDEVFETIVNSLQSTSINVRKEAVICMSNIIVTMDPSLLYNLLTQKFTDLLQTYLKNLLIMS